MGNEKKVDGRAGFEGRAITKDDLPQPGLSIAPGATGELEEVCRDDRCERNGGTHPHPPAYAGDRFEMRTIVRIESRSVGTQLALDEDEPTIVTVGARKRRDAWDVPRVSLPSGAFTREEWIHVRDAVDACFAEYARRFG